jgi:hypothetical protein
MDPHRAAIVFIGDLSDPWVADIARAIPTSQGVDQVDCPGDLPENVSDPRRPPRLVVVHRHRLTATDLRRLREWRQPAVPYADSATVSTPPPVFLCASPFLRYDEISRAGGLVDLVLSEAEAAQVLPGRIARLFGGSDDDPTGRYALSVRVAVSGGNAALCDMIADACTAAGIPATRVDDLPADEMPSPSRPPDSRPARADSRAHAAERTLTIWEIPVLEPDWSERLARRAQSHQPVIALIGFADRALVSEARAAGAAACLELPFRVEDLVDVIHAVTDRYSPNTANPELAPSPPPVTGIR